MPFHCKPAEIAAYKEGMSFFLLLSALYLPNPFLVTQYYVVLESDYAQSSEQVDILDMEDHLITVTSLAFKKALDIEGTGKLNDGRVINYSGRKPDGIRYEITQNLWGNGVGRCQLEPFRSIAVDPKLIPLGSKVEIKETIGMPLPDGSIHDGIWRAEDVGGAIREDHIDLFIGYRKNSSYLKQAGIGGKARLTVKLHSNPEPDNCTERHLSL